MCPMPDSMSRPAHLPDYRYPSINEVVLGVQFASVPGYQQIRAMEVWDLYRSDFPKVQELAPIAPSFETFGLPPLTPMLNMGIVTGALHNRFWFLSKNEAELIQFQQDRLLHNWRKVGDQKNEYPRFERMITRFENELLSLEKYFRQYSVEGLAYNQVEISYINNIVIEDRSVQAKASDWFQFLNFESKEPNDVNILFRRILQSPSGQPFGRLICEVSTAMDIHSKLMFIFTITVRGAPSEPKIGAALDFLKLGRELIVTEFAERTTENAQIVWGKI